MKISLIREADKIILLIKKKKSMKNSPNHQGLILVSFPKIKRFKLHPMQAKLTKNPKLSTWKKLSN